MIRFSNNPNFFGGTEYMVTGYHANIAPHLKNMSQYNQIVAPGVFPNPLDSLTRPLVIWLHNPPSQFHETFYSFLSHPLPKQRTVAYIVPSNFCKNSWVKFGLEEEKIHVIPNAIATDLPTRTSTGNKVPTFIYTSNEARGLEFLLLATESFDFDFHLEVFSGFRPGEKDFFGGHTDTTWVKNLKNYEKMTFYGFSPRKTVLKHLSQADVFLYPSTFLETFCLSAVEAVSMGLPAIVSHVGALPEIIGDNCEQVVYEDSFVKYINNDSGVFMYDYSKKFPKHHSKNVEKLVSAVRSVIENPPTQQELEKRQKAMFERYSWDVVKQKWIEFDNSLESLTE